MQEKIQTLCPWGQKKNADEENGKKDFDSSAGFKFNLASLAAHTGKLGKMDNPVVDGPKKSNIQLIIEKQERDRETIAAQLREQDEERKRAALGMEEEGAMDPKKKKMIQLSEYSVVGNILKNSKRKAIEQTGRKDRVEFDIDGREVDSDDDD